MYVTDCEPDRNNALRAPVAFGYRMSQKQKA